jgi:hypothetical protein
MFGALVASGRSAFPSHSFFMGVEMKVNKALLAAAAITLLSPLAANATNLVLNGDFSATSATSSGLASTNTMTDWTNNGTFVLLCMPNTCDNNSVVGGGFALAGPNDGFSNGFTTSPDGGNFVAFDSDPDFHGTLTQTITGLTAGTTYQLSFYMGGAEEINIDETTTTEITATFAGQSFSTPTITTPGNGFSPWVQYTTTFTANGTSDVLSFLATGGPSGDPPYALLDGVSLTAVTAGGGVPEPAIWAMMLVGFGGVGAAIRSRRKLAAAAA